MIYSTKYSKELTPIDVCSFVAKNLNKNIIDMAQTENGIIEFSVESEYYNTVNFLLDDFCISSKNKDIITKLALNKKWRSFMVQKFGESYVKDLNKNSRIQQTEMSR